MTNEARLIIEARVLLECGHIKETLFFKSDGRPSTYCYCNTCGTLNGKRTRKYIKIVQEVKLLPFREVESGRHNYVTYRRTSHKPLDSRLGEWDPTTTRFHIDREHKKIITVVDEPRTVVGFDPANTIRGELTIAHGTQTGRMVINNPPLQQEPLRHTFPDWKALAMRPQVSTSLHEMMEEFNAGVGSELSRTWTLPDYARRDIELVQQIYGKEENMSTIDMASVYRARAEELEKKAAIMDSFGKEGDYKEGTVISFKRNFGVRKGTKYNYAAIKGGNGLWYVTGTGRGSRYGINFNVLVEEYLFLAVEDGFKVRVMGKGRVIGR
jgi:hypothetical protein